MILTKKEQLAKVKEIMGGGEANYSYNQKITAVKNWYDFEGTDLSFKMDLVHSCAERLSRGVFLSAAQKKAVDKIISGFNIEIKDYA